MKQMYTNEWLLWWKFPLTSITIEWLHFYFYSHGLQHLWGAQLDHGCHRIPRSLKILYGSSDFVTKHILKTKRNADLLLVSLFCSSAFTLSRNNWNSVQHLSQICMDDWGCSGGSWESSWRHLGPKTAQISTKIDLVTWWPPWEPNRQPKLDNKIIWR